VKTYRVIIKSLLLVVFIGAVFFFWKDPSYPGSFAVDTISDRIRFSGHQDFSGATLVNLDEDPESEIFISSHGSKNLFLKRKHDLFFPIEIDELSDAEGLTYSVTACDLDSDGRDELLVLNQAVVKGRTSHSRVLKYGSGKWTDLLPEADPLLPILSTGYSSTCVDRKGDGRYGLAISNSSGTHLYLELVEGKIVNIAEVVGLNLNSKGRSILAVPGPTGHQNIFIGNEEGPNFYFKNKGDGTFIEVASQVGLSDPEFDARGISLIDVNNDDLPDVVYGNHYGPTRLLEQGRDGRFKDVTPEKMIKSYAVNSAVVGDFNLDGYEDVYTNNIRDDNKLFSQYATDWYELQIPSLAEDKMFGISTIAGDLDGNGSFEILNTHGDGGKFPLTLYTIKPVGDWIKFSVRYKTGAVPRGAIVKLRTSIRDLVRVISPGSGRFANYDTDVVFGLLKNESPLSLDVTLPSGKKASFEKSFSVLSNNKIDVEY